MGQEFTLGQQLFCSSSVFRGTEIALTRRQKKVPAKCISNHILERSSLLNDLHSHNERDWLNCFPKIRPEKNSGPVLLHTNRPMRLRSALRLILASLVLALCVPCGVEAVPQAGQSLTCPPILLYHRFGAAPADSMTVTTSVFTSHLEYLKANGYTVVPLRRLLNDLNRKVQPPAKSVAIVVDDAHISVYTDMLPLVKKYRIPVTLFIYPSAVSNASYAMSWPQLKELQKTGFFDMQSHTFWHPNFKKERKKLTATQYEQLVKTQLGKAKARLEQELGTRVDMLAWPFGIYDDFLMARAKDAGYVAAFTIEGNRDRSFENPMKIPRYLISNSDRGKRFERILSTQEGGQNGK